MTDKKTEALKLALEALEAEHSAVYGTSRTARAITAIDEALAEQPAPVAEPHKQEPVAFEIRAFNATQALIKRADVAQEKADVLERGFGSEADVTIVPLYTSPQPGQSRSDVKPWVGLTEEDVLRIKGQFKGTLDVQFDKFAYAIEAKLREKNA